MVPKTIWMLWLQGWDEAPWLVRQAAESWETNNPDWKIEYLTERNLHHYADDIDYVFSDRTSMLPQTKSDVIRLSLLKNHGGVWADATLLCMQPLSPWIDQAVSPAGLWMYHGPGGGMRIDDGPVIWFIASEKDSMMANRWKQASDLYWSSNDRTDTYFWLDGLFREVFESDEQFRKCWRRAPHLLSGAKGQSHMLGFPGGSTTSDSRIKRILEERPPYVLKLWWKRWSEAFPDVDSDECKESNGYHAILMSKRRITYQHAMLSKTSPLFSTRMRAVQAKRFCKNRYRSILRSLSNYE